MQLSNARIEALQEIVVNRELLKKGHWWGTQTKEWLVGDRIMDALKRHKLVRIDVVGDSAFAVITPKGARAVAAFSSSTSRPEEKA